MSPSTLLIGMMTRKRKQHSHISQSTLNRQQQDQPTKERGIENGTRLNVSIYISFLSTKVCSFPLSKWNGKNSSRERTPFYLTHFVDRETFWIWSAGLPLWVTAPAERSTKSEQLELTKGAKGEQSEMKSKSNERERVGPLANQLDQVGRLFE